MKNVLILVLSCNQDPYPMLTQSSLDTWDSIDVDGVETRFFFGLNRCPSNPKCIHFDVQDRYEDMGRKCILAYEWALRSDIKWDYIARVNSSCYVRKIRLLDQCQYLDSKNVFRGVGTPGPEGRTFIWGGAQYIISRDVVEQMIAHKDKWPHKYMEDVAMSFHVADLGRPLDTGGYACGVNRLPAKWLCLAYHDHQQSGFEFDHMCEMHRAKDQYFVRVKQDLKRHLDVQIMKDLFLCGF